MMEKSKPKLLLLGGGGFIGSNLLKPLANLYNVRVYTRWQRLDDKLYNYAPDVVVNCAAEIYNVDQMFSTNIVLVNQCLQYLQKYPHVKFLHFGSSSEYGAHDTATAETSCLTPNDIYGSTKASASLLCQSWAKHLNLDVRILRPYSPYGPGEKPHRLFPRLWQAFQRDVPLELNQGVHDFLYIDDLVDLVMLLLDSPACPGEIINVASGQQYTNHEVLSTFERVTGRAAPVTETNIMTTPAVWRANIDLARDKYQWTPKIDLEQGVRLFLERASY